MAYLWTCLVLLSWVRYIDAAIFYGDHNFGDESINSNTLILRNSRLPNGKCKYKIKGRGVNFEHPDDCPVNYGDSQINSDNYYAMYYPDYIPFGLYTDTTGTMVIVKPEGCTLKIQKTRTSTALSKDVCDKIKKKIADELKKNQEYWRKWKINFHREMKGPPPGEIMEDPLKNQQPTPSLYVDQKKGTGSAHSDTGDTDSDVGKVPSSSPAPQTQQPVKPSTPDALQQFKVTYPLGMDDWGKSYPSYQLTLNKYTNSFNVKGCNFVISVKGFDISEHLQVACSAEQSNAVSTKDFLAYGSPTSTLALFSDTPGTLIILNKGTCYERRYGTTLMGPTLMSVGECEEIKKRMKKRLDTNGKVFPGGLSASGDITDDDDSSKASQASGSVPPTTSSTSNDEYDSDKTEDKTKVTWQSGSFAATYSPIVKVSVSKNNNGPNDCTVRISIFGRGMRDVITNKCSVMGENLLEKTTVSKVAIGDPSTRSGLYTEGWSSLVVVMGGRCTRHTYESSPITNKTKSTPTPLDPAKCARIMKKLSVALRKK